MEGPPEDGPANTTMSHDQALFPQTVSTCPGTKQIPLPVNQDHSLEFFRETLSEKLKIHIPPSSPFFLSSSVSRPAVSSLR